MKVILGLGNPGREYEKTRHNVGWWLLDALHARWHFDGWKKDGQAMVAQGRVEGVKEPVRLVKPQTYMNLSGAVLATYARRPFWSFSTDLVVLVDEVAIPAGTWRFRAEGGTSGHNGLKSVQQALGGSQKYPRLRLGVGPAEGQTFKGDLADYVLGRTHAAEESAIRDTFPACELCLEAWVRDGNQAALDVQSRGGK